jgi:glycosyltransferase involved in cell wall biosynthesis
MIPPISHPYEPDGYGPWERVTHDLTERLVELGVDVTLFAPSGSKTGAHLVETVEGPLSALPGADPRLMEETHLAIAMEAARDLSIDLIHSHLHVHALVYSSLIPGRLLSTLHGVAWDQANHPLLRRYRDQAFVSLSQSERRFLPELRYVATVANGIRVNDFPLGEGDGGYLAFVGRMAPEKGPDLAIETARLAGMRLRMAGMVEDRHRAFFDGLDLAGPDVEYLGPLDRHDVAALLGEAHALVMPLRWEEPFGLVVVESLAAGTPVIAWRRGAMEEIVEDGVTGFLVDDVLAAAASVPKVGSLSRVGCRARAATRFSDTRMASEYGMVYDRIVSTSSGRGLARAL